MDYEIPMGSSNMAEDQKDFRELGILWILFFSVLTLVLLQAFIMGTSISEHGWETVAKNPQLLFLTREESLLITPYEIGSKIIYSFNKDTKTIFSLSYHGKNYEFIYRESIIPFASRYELISDDGPVTDPDTAVRILKFAAWNDQEVLSRISSLDVQELNKIKYDAERINYITSPIYSVVHPLKINFDKTKKISVMGYSLFDALIKDYRVRYFYRAIKSLDDETGKWSYRTTHVIKAVDRMVYDIQLVNSGSKIDPEDLEEDFTSASSVLSSYQSGFDSMAGDMNELLDKSNYVKNFIISKFPKAKFLIYPIERVENVISRYKQDIESYSYKIENQKDKINTIVSIAKSKEQSYYGKYVSQFYVPYLFGCVLVILLTVVAYALLMFLMYPENKKTILKRNIRRTLITFAVTIFGIFIFYTLMHTINVDNILLSLQKIDVLKTYIGYINHPESLFFLNERPNLPPIVIIFFIPELLLTSLSISLVVGFFGIFALILLDIKEIIYDKNNNKKILNVKKTLVSLIFLFIYFNVLAYVGLYVAPVSILVPFGMIFIFGTLIFIAPILSMLDPEIFKLDILEIIAIILAGIWIFFSSLIPIVIQELFSIQSNFSFYPIYLLIFFVVVSIILYNLRLYLIVISSIISFVIYGIFIVITNETDLISNIKNIIYTGFGGIIISLSLIMIFAIGTIVILFIIFAIITYKNKLLDFYV